MTSPEPGPAGCRLKGHTAQDGAALLERRCARLDSNRGPVWGSREEGSARVAGRSAYSCWRARSGAIVAALIAAIRVASRAATPSTTSAPR